MDQGVNSIPTLLFKLGILEEVECETRFFLDFNHHKDAQKAKRMKVSVTTVKGPKKVRMKGEFSGKVGTRMDINLSDQYCKFVPTTFKMEEIHKAKSLHVYAKEAEKKKMDALWSLFGHKVKFVIVAQATHDNLDKAELHNWITLDKFMEGKNKPFQVMATEFLIADLMQAKRSTFSRIELVNEVSKDLADKLYILDTYHKNNVRSYACDETKRTVIAYAKEHNLFDQPIYLVYKQVNEVFTKLPFLNAIMDRIGYINPTDAKNNPMIQAVVDLFKYHKQKVNLEHYTIKLTEDAPLEDALTEDTITELQII
jgi:hypothetical protein